MKPKNYRNIRKLQLVCLMLTVIVLLSVYAFWSNIIPASAEDFPNLRGQEAVEHLQNRGVFESVEDAYKAARREDELVDPQIRLTANDPQEGDMFFSTTVSVSGNTAVVGCSSCKIGNNVEQGSVYVFIKSTSGWAIQQKLTAADGAAGESFGSWVEIEGETLVIGASEADVNSNQNQGAVYVFVRSNTTWMQQQKFTSNDGGTNDKFGLRVAISGNTIAVGAEIADLLDPGAVYVFVRSGNVWTQHQRLVRIDGIAVDDFSYSLDIEGDTLIAGARRNNFGRGAVYVFSRSGTTWTEQQKIVGNDLQEGVNFGVSVALNGNLIAVGAVGTQTVHGAAYIFTRNGNSWTQQKKLTANEFETVFGQSIALKNNNLFVSASLETIGNNQTQGAVYHFAYDGSDWFQQRKLVSTVGAANDRFGFSVATDGQTTLIGAPRYDVGANIDQGAAFLYECGRTEQRQLTANDGAAFDQFGSAVAVSGETVVIGAPLEEEAGGASQGAVYVFVRNGGSWIQQAKLKSNPPLNNAEFGHSVDISGNTIVVGAWKETVGTTDTQGAAYVFVRNGATWTQQARLLASDGNFQDQFGNAVAIDGETIVLGSIFDDVGTTLNQGSVYVFTRSGSIWTQQARINATDGAANDNFGNAVDISGESVLVGANRKATFQGAAYVFIRTGAIWSQQQKITATDGVSGDEFGFTVTLDGDTAAIGAYKDDTDQFQDNGSVYVFTRSGSTWTQQQKLIQDVFFAQFGYALALDGDNLLIGNGGGLNIAWLYVRSGTNWSSGEEFTGTINSDFGEAVGISGATVISGALAKTVGGNSQQGDATVYYGDCSSAPVGISSAPITRRRCKAATQATLGTVSDGQDSPGSLIVTAQTVPARITLTNLLNTNGTITANVGAECTATLGAKTVVLKVSDAGGGVSNFNATVNVIEQKPADFDGDGKSDFSIWRAGASQWWILQSSNNNASATNFGLQTDRIAPGDYDGDGKTDIAVFRPPSGVWYWLNSSNGSFAAVNWGAIGDIPTPSDYDGDGKSDLAVFRPSNGVWYVRKSSDGGISSFKFGQNGDKPVTGDYDGDGQSDYAVFRPSNGIWYIQQSTAGFAAVQFGLTGDKPVQSDYDGDSKTDIGVYRPSNRTWYLLQSIAGISIQTWGVEEDILRPEISTATAKRMFASFARQTAFGMSKKAPAETCSPNSGRTATCRLNQAIFLRINK